ncbi:hypothetical protein ET445_01030 [Agromyces protaetiae]|uniref:Uncharacterized protein n=1 Tax=Agromyces protaetiae TaxID=2509455 RepID=A0A4P6F966_9MICO|nr:hypothetical protein [Agromyces protaetiae]QAY72125.1 hypothetical protein ET445_01030 [Agromyces protaetiae]
MTEHQTFTGYDSAELDAIDRERADAVERTVVVVRNDATAADDPESDVDRTVIVGRPAALGLEDDVDRTVVVGRPQDATFADAVGEDEVDRTVVVGRPTQAAQGAPATDEDEADRTVVVGRAGAVSAHSDADEVDRTVVTGRGRPSGGAAESDAATPSAAAAAGAAPRALVPTALRRRGGRRELSPAPLDPATLRAAVPGRGAGATERYAPRAEPKRVTPPPAIAVDDRPTRDLRGALPNLARRSRQGALARLVIVGGTTVVSAAGLVTLVLLALAGL